MATILILAAITFPLSHAQQHRAQVMKYSSELEYFLKHARMLAIEKGGDVNFCHTHNGSHDTLKVYLRSSSSTSCDGTLLKSLDFPPQKAVRLDSSHLEGYYDPRGKFQSSVSNPSVCVNVRGISHFAFQLEAYGLVQSQGNGLCS